MAAKQPIESSKQPHNYISNKVRELECPNGYSLRAYRDYKHYSIWCWTRSYKWETVTVQEAESRFNAKVNEILTRKQKDLLKYNDNQKAALVSLYFNIPLWYYNVTKWWNVNTKTWLLYVNAWWKRLEWLVKRRQAEVALFNKSLVKKY